MTTYRHSHELWAMRHRLGYRWDACGKYLEYSEHFATAIDSEPKSSKIAFRAVHEEIEKLILVFEAESDIAVYQERIELINISQKPVIWTLTNIPYQNIWVSKESESIHFSWNSYSIKVFQLKLKNRKEVERYDSLRFSLVHNWILNSTWKYKWGNFWNLNEIMHAKRELRMYWKYAFGKPEVIVYMPHHHGINEQGLVNLLVDYVIEQIRKIMTKDFIISLQFWFAIWSGLYVLNEKELKWRRGSDSIEEKKLL